MLINLLQTNRVHGLIIHFYDMFIHIVYVMQAT
jgi:hypothetical protein